jgi:hypothetical protein
VAKYRLLDRAVIDGAVREAGEEIDFEGIPGPHMESLDKLGKPMPELPELDPYYRNGPGEDHVPGVRHGLPRLRRLLRERSHG